MDDQLQRISIFNHPGRPAGECKTRFLNDDELNKARLLVLLNCNEVLPILDEYRKSARYYSQLTDQQVEESIEKYFVLWFQQYVHNPQNMVNNQFLHDFGPKSIVKTWPRFFVNGHVFHIDSITEYKTTCNSGVFVKGDGSSEFYGILQEVIQLEYPGLPEKKVVLFSCDWFDSVSRRGIKRNDQYGLLEIKINESYPKNDPFILAQHAFQVYYVPYPGTRRDKVHWRFVVKTKPRSRITKGQTIEAPLQEHCSFVNPVVDTDPPGDLVDAHGRSEQVNIENIQIMEFDEVGEVEYEEEEEETEEDEEEDEYEDEDEEDEDEDEDEEDEDYNYNIVLLQRC